MRRALWFLGLIMIGIILLGLSPGVAPAQVTDTLRLAARGRYGVGLQDFTYVDDNREGREVTGVIWYPAQAGRSSYLMPEYQAAPDTAAAPYPLIMYSHFRGAQATDTLGTSNHLASHGFVVVSINHNDPADFWLNLSDRPMDILFVLDQLAAAADEGTLAGQIDFERVGVTGYSYGSRTALLFSGVQIDPVSREEYCAAADQSGSEICVIGPDIWQQVVDYRAQFDPPLVEGEPWPAYTDERIEAVMSIAPCYGPLYGERGLANATVPILVVGLTEDEVCPYERDAAYIYEHMGSADRSLLTVLGIGHLDAIVDANTHDIFNHFAVAFFGYHLQGNTNYAQFLSAESVSGFYNLQWASSME